MDVREETLGGSGRQDSCEGSKYKTADADKEWKDSQPNIREDFQTADRKARRRIFYRVTEDQVLDVVLGSTTPKTKQKKKLHREEELVM
jgi:hypothetical protein